MRRSVLVLLLLGAGGCDDEIVGFDSGSTGMDETLGSTSVPDPTTTSITTDSDDSGSSSSGDVPALGFPRWVAYGFYAGIAVSHDDGETWMDVPDIEGMEVQEDLARGEDWVVMVGGFDAARSADGISWEHVDVDLGYARAVVYGSGGYASVGQNHIAWSWDGVTWEDARGGVSDVDLVEIAYAEGRFVAVGVGVLATSENGVDWTITDIGGEKLHSVTYGSGRFVAVSEMGRIVETADGVTVLRDAASGLGGFGEIAFCHQEFVVGGADRFWVSPDAEAWTEVFLSNQGTLGCNDTAYIIPKDEGIFRSPVLDQLELVHVPAQPLGWVRSTDYP